MKLDKLTILMLFGAACFTGVAGRNITGTTQEAPSIDVPLYMGGWEEGLNDDSGVRIIGSDAAEVKVLVLFDLECPACKVFHSILAEAAAKVPNGFDVRYIHYPLPYHASALMAANAAECARQQGRFSEWVEAVYARQDSLGIRTWRNYAVDAGISDTEGIEQCAQGTDPRPMVAKGIAFGEAMGAHGTPTVIVNGWKLPATPFPEDLIAFLPRGGDYDPFIP